MTRDQDDATIIMSSGELDALIEKASKKAAREVLSEVGIFTTDEGNRAEALQDILWLRRWRKAFDAAAGTIGRTVLVVLLGAIMGAMWLGAQMQIMKPPHP